MLFRDGPGLVIGRADQTGPPARRSHGPGALRRLWTRQVSLRRSIALVAQIAIWTSFQFWQPQCGLASDHARLSTIAHDKMPEDVAMSTDEAVREYLKTNLPAMNLAREGGRGVSVLRQELFDVLRGRDEEPMADVDPLLRGYRELVKHNR